MTMQVLALIGGGIIAAALVLIWASTIVYNNVDDPEIKSHVTALLYLVDEQCDNLEVPAKRILVIIALQQLLGWRRIFLPTIIVGFVLDIMLAIVRKIGCPDLHKDKPTETEAQL